MSATASFRLPFIMPRPVRANVTTVKSVYADFSRLSKRGGIASYVATHFDADCEYRPVEEANPVRGHAALTRWLGRWLEAWDDAWDEIDELYETDETVVTAIRTHGRDRKSGLEISQRLFDVFELRRGMVVRVTEYLEPREALAAAGLRSKRSTRTRLDRTLHLRPPGLRVERGQDPRGASGIPRIDVVARRNLHDDVEVVGAAAQASNVLH